MLTSYRRTIAVLLSFLCIVSLVSANPVSLTAAPACDSTPPLAHNFFHQTGIAKIDDILQWFVTFWGNRSTIEKVFLCWGGLMLFGGITGLDGGKQVQYDMVRPCSKNFFVRIASLIMSAHARAMCKGNSRIGIARRQSQSLFRYSNWGKEDWPHNHGTLQKRCAQNSRELQGLVHWWKRCRRKWGQDALQRFHLPSRDSRIHVPSKLKKLVGVDAFWWTVPNPNSSGLF